MDLSRTRLVLRERAVIDVLDLALRFLVEHAGAYAKTSLLVLPPFILASVAVAHFGGWLATWLFAIFAGTLAGAPFTVLESRLVFEDDVQLVRTIKHALQLTPRLFALRVVTFVVGGAGLAFLLFPGIWFLAWTLFVIEVALLERATARGAISRSMRIVGRESSEAVLGLLLLSVLTVVAVVSADIGGRAIISALLESRAPDPIWEDGGSVLGLLGFWLFVPYAATARFFVYLDVRTRSEGWDIQTRFVAIATRAASVDLARSAA